MSDSLLLTSFVNDRKKLNHHTVGVGQIGDKMPLVKDKMSSSARG